MTRAIDRDIKLANVTLALKPKYINPKDLPRVRKFGIETYLWRKSLSRLTKELLIRHPPRSYLKAAGLIWTHTEVIWDSYELKDAQIGLTKLQCEK
jgi:hypothetical protein